MVSKSKKYLTLCVVHKQVKMKNLHLKMYVIKIVRKKYIHKLAIDNKSIFDSHRLCKSSQKLNALKKIKISKY